jgi:hypothetical protein
MNALQKLKDKGIQQFYLNLAGHGDNDGVYFVIDEKYVTLSPEELFAAFDKFEDCKFVVNTVACHGGGFAEKMKGYKDKTGKIGRIQMRLQSKGHAANQEGRIAGEVGQKNSPKTFSAYYQIFYNDFIKTHSDGEAHWLADRKAKQYVACDAEHWISGPAGGGAQKGLD